MKECEVNMQVKLDSLEENCAMVENDIVECYRSLKNHLVSQLHEREQFLLGQCNVHRESIRENIQNRIQRLQQQIQVEIPELMDKIKEADWLSLAKKNSELNQSFMGTFGMELSQISEAKIVLKIKENLSIEEIINYGTLEEILNYETFGAETNNQFMVKILI
jgi:hypothetical protein